MDARRRAAERSTFDFGEKWIEIAGVRSATTTGAKPWPARFRAFCGVTRKILFDRAGALVIGSGSEDRRRSLQSGGSCVAVGLTLD